MPLTRLCSNHLGTPIMLTTNTAINSWCQDYRRLWLHCVARQPGHHAVWLRASMRQRITIVKTSSMTKRTSSSKPQPQISPTQTRKNSFSSLADINKNTINSPISRPTNSASITRNDSTNVWLARKACQRPLDTGKPLLKKVCSRSNRKRMVDYADCKAKRVLRWRLHPPTASFTAVRLSVTRRAVFHDYEELATNEATIGVAIRWRQQPESMHMQYDYGQEPSIDFRDRWGWPLGGQIDRRTYSTRRLPETRI